MRNSDTLVSIATQSSNQLRKFSRRCDSLTANAERETVLDAIKNLCFIVFDCDAGLSGISPKPVLIVFPTANAERETIGDVIKETMFFFVF